MYDDGGDAAMDLGGNSAYDDMDSMSSIRAPFGTGNTHDGSPVEGSGNNSGGEDAMGNSTPGGGSSAPSTGQMGAINPGGVGGSMSVLGKPIATNNFVTKLYQ
jgi:hypothetical protein